MWGSLANEVLQWGVLVVIAVVLLGVLRQVALALPTQYRAQTVSGPSIGSRLPRPLLRRLPSPLPDGSSHAGEAILAFVTEACVGCQRLLSEVSARHAASDAPLVLVARNPSGPFQQALEDLSTPIIHDDGRIWAACQVTNTPLVVRIDSEGRVIAKGVTHDVDSVGAVAS